MSVFRGRTPWTEEKKKRPPLFSTGEKAGMALCLAMLLFAISDGDVPLAFFSLSFLVYEGYNVVSKVGGERFHALASFLLGLGIALFAGSIVMAFF